MQTLTSEPSSARAAVLRRFAAPAFVAVICFAAFSPALDGKFVFDDIVNFVENERYRGLSGANLLWMFTHFDGHYQPITWMSAGVDYLIWGLDPWGYHLTSLLLHCANALLFYRLLLDLLPRVRALAGSRGGVPLVAAAACGALFFGIHPLRVESAAWVTERKGVLCLFFALASLHYYLRAGTEGVSGAARTRAIAASVAFFALSIFSKAMAMTLPVLLLLLDAYPLRRLQGAAQIGPLLREKIPYFVVLAAGVAAEIVAERLGQSFDPWSNYGLADALSQPAYRLAFYWWKTLVPTGLVAIYLLPVERDPTAPVFLLCAAGAAIASALLVAFARRVPALLLTWLAFALLLSPTLGLVQAGYHYAADRNAYFASLAPAALVAGALAWLWSRPRLRVLQALAALGAVAALLALGVLSHRQSKVWLDSESLWTHALEHDPENYFAHYNLACELDDQGDLDRAIDHYSRAIWARDDLPRFFYNRALAWVQKGHVDRAIADFDRTIELDPDHWLALSNRGGLHLDLGHYREAISDLSRAIDLQPERGLLYATRARAFWMLGDEESARADRERSRSLR